MMKGYSLEQDLRLLINNPKYSDIEILCEDEKKFHGCRAILAARSEVFDRLLYNGMKESYENQISFPKINSIGMEIILEYTYTGSVKKESLTKDSIVEAFYAADYFQLPDLQDFIVETLKNTIEENHTEENYMEENLTEILSKFAEKMPLTEDNPLLNLLIEEVAMIPLNTIEFGRLSISGLQYLLSCTHEKEKPFVTPEYEVFRYSAILAAKQVSNDAYETVMERLPTLKHIKDSTQLENESIIDIQKVAKELEPLVKYIDFRRIKGDILVDIIEPLNIIPPEIIIKVYRYNTKTKQTNSTLDDVRGIRITKKLDHAWNKSACGTKLIIKDNGKVVCASHDLKLHQNVSGKMILGNKGIYEWDVIIEKDCGWSCVGVCASEDFDYEIRAGEQKTGWVLGAGGYCYNSGTHFNYCPEFGDGSIITVHLDMNKRTCAFTVNGKKYREVSEWNNLPSKLYPVASLFHPGRIRIQPLRKPSSI